MNNLLRNELAWLFLHKMMSHVRDRKSGNFDRSHFMKQIRLANSKLTEVSEHKKREFIGLLCLTD